MANRWTEEPDTGEQPKSDLNPLLNPVLEENLGRWAQVYFTNPPEKRERAVMDLLRELENRANGVPAASGEARTENGSTNAEEKIRCASCNLENRADQRFCGFCGASLQARGVDATSFSSPESVSFLGLAAAPAGGPPENDLAFLREKSFEKAYYEPESGHRAGYIVVALLILLGGLGYLSWPVLRTRLPASWQPAVQTRVQPSSQPPSATTSEPAAQPSASLPQTTSSVPPESASDETTAPPQPAPASAHAAPSANAPSARAAGSARTVTLASDTHASRAASDGEQELLQAQHYLDQSNTPTNRAEAARWLWKSVGKQNPQAALLLADMYTRGDGVSKSCDQARILLGAAARKGVSDAGARLRSLESNGCR